MVRLILIGWIIALLFPAVAPAAQAAPPAAPMVYTYPPPESGEDQRLAYYWTLLKSALDAGRGFRL